MTVLATASGRLIDLAAPSHEAIRLEDIAIQLAATNRFNGATSNRGGAPYSVAQHSVVVARIAGTRVPRRPLTQLQALLHDAHEAYTGDITTPMKQALGDFREGVETLQLALDAAIHDALRVPLPNEFERDIIHGCDMIALATEWRDLMPGSCPNGVTPASFAVKPMPWDRAEELFLKTFHRLSLAAGIAPKFNPVPTGIFK